MTHKWFTQKDTRHLMKPEKTLGHHGPKNFYVWVERDREKTLGVSLRHTTGQKKISLRHTSHFWGCHQGMSRCQNPEVARSDIPKNYNTMNQKQKIKSTYQAQEQRQSIQSLPTFRQEETMQNQHPTLAPCHK